MKLLQPRRHGLREAERRGETDSERSAGEASARRKYFWLFSNYFPSVSSRIFLRPSVSTALRCFLASA